VCNTLANVRETFCSFDASNTGESVEIIGEP